MKKTIRLFALLMLLVCQAGMVIHGAVPAQSTPATAAPVVDEFPSKQNRASTSQLAEIAVQHLASRLDLGPELITVIDMTPVIWPSGSLGCPQEEMVYEHAKTGGFIVTLEANGKRYPYHTDSGQRVISCESPQLPVFPVTPGEIDDGQPWMPVD